jgi:PAS domain S-box-containing protein
MWIAATRQTQEVRPMLPIPVLVLASVIVLALILAAAWLQRQRTTAHLRCTALERDICRLSSQLADLRLSEARHELVERLADAGGFEWDLSNGRIQWSPTLERACGLRPGGFGGTFEDWRRLVHPEDLPRVAKSLGEAIAGRAEYGVVFRIVRSDGTHRWLSGRGRTLRDSSGRPFQIVGVNLDVTDLLQTAAVMQRADLPVDDDPLPSSSGDGAQAGHVELRSLITRAADSHASLLQAQGLSLSLSMPPGSVDFDADPTALDELVAVLLRHVMAAKRPGSTIHVDARIVGKFAILAGSAREVDRPDEVGPVRVATAAETDASPPIDLAGARQQAARLGGTLHVDVDGDSRFTLTLPLTPDVARVPLARVGSR